ncbi:MAG: ATP-dependent DNA ligase [Candidatus Aenigmarchaeota archaeon]|nr:ATP-dependent DNA ligase [Candidatus Aenigmarchaeota archaeon]NIP39898.1 ATP-dependent DNA ligase [Candidatus Aenigmarchaeota archaeon]NIQ17617.1 ATP-dependent DNA ligase [Candidatus Aenigmarchaeota archaeon]NIS72805.1 ATP-dependent DNA ligase [Candidatus Aenigmarchaeota archaeon]
MKYSKLVDLYEYLEQTSSRLKKIERIADFLRKAETSVLGKVTLLIQGRIYPSYSEMEIGVADKMIIKVIASSTGFQENEVIRAFKETGDLGLSVEKLMGKKKQKTLISRELGIEKVFENLRKLAKVEGKGSQDVKVSLVRELISHAKPKEAKYIVRTVLEQLRIGVAEGVLRDSIAEAFFSGKDKEEKREIVRTIEWAWFLRPDYSEIARIAKEKGLKGLRKVSIEIGKPYHVLLAEKAKDLNEAVEKFERPSLEFKYDGARVSIHRKGEEFWFYTRRLENITSQFPDLLDLARKGIKSKECIIEGEMLGVDPKTRNPLPFQMLSQRIKRKYDIERMAKEIPIQVNLFDVVFCNGRNLFSEPLEKRRGILEKIVKPIPGKFQLAERLVTKDIKEAEDFYNRALRAKQEGVIVKNLDAKYQPGRRVGYWLKVKPIMETLDLVITGAEWGTGKRANWLGSFILSCRKGDEFLECGMMGTGIKEKGEGVTFEDLTKQLKPCIEDEKGKSVRIKPKIVVEVAYEEIQKSPNYSSGYALRFPRLLRIRVDKSPSDADDVGRIEKLHRQQRGREF